ncbi:MAG: class I SAM-dependent methyltransferase [Candidatus Aenigmarchaeota archaeon]|nr:class I SAM-dependent methyltransferase [Candidatus Aenigmarchaeota archaeon]
MKEEWENLANIYAKKRWYGKGLFKFERILLQKISNFVDSVIDVGCGTGRHIRVLKQKNVFVIGLDFSLNMIKEAKKMCNAFYILGDARELPFKDSSVDCCICLGNTIASVGEKRNKLIFGAQLAIDEMLRTAEKLVVVDFREGKRSYEKRFINNIPYTTRSWKLKTAIDLFKKSKHKEKIRKMKLVKNVKLGGHNFFYIICFLK